MTQCLNYFEIVCKIFIPSENSSVVFKIFTFSFLSWLFILIFFLVQTSILLLIYLLMCIYLPRKLHSLTVIIRGNGLWDLSSNPGRACFHLFFLLRCYPIYSSPTPVNRKGKTDLFSHSSAIDLEEKLWFHTIWSRLNIDQVSHSALIYLVLFPSLLKA